MSLSHRTDTERALNIALTDLVASLNRASEDKVLKDVCKQYADELYTALTEMVEDWGYRNGDHDALLQPDQQPLSVARAMRVLRKINREIA